MENVIEVSNLHRDYYRMGKSLFSRKTSVTAVDGVSFVVKKGEIFGLLGQNGAGKTTIIKILTTLLVPTKGSCKVLGYDCSSEEKKIRPRINFIFGGEMGVYRRLSGRDNLRYFANLYMIDRKDREERIESILGLVDLQERADDLVETYSKGMIQRLQIARGLINNPEIIFMDEPTIGLDPVGARMLRKIIVQLRNDGHTVILTTHYLAEADELCDHLVIIDKGKIVASGTTETIKQGYDSLEDAYLNYLKKT